MHALVTFILYRNYAALGNFFSLMPTLTTFLKPKSKTLPPAFVLLFWFGTAVAWVAAAYGMAARKNRARKGGGTRAACIRHAPSSLSQAPAA